MIRQVEWSYLFTVMEKFGIGKNFISLTKMLYLKPSASVLTNLEKSKYFTLGRGTRQGCPLSPLLFALAIEPLAISIRENDQIKPININNFAHKISLYADDIALFVGDPGNSIPHLLRQINSFGEVSGYTINWQKSEIMVIGKDSTPQYLDSIRFKPANTVKYLGIKMTKNPNSLFKHNFLELMKSLKTNIEKWKTLPISMIGRVNAIKMTTLPRFLYLFQNIPISLPTSFFKQLNSIILPFIWDYKAHRISKLHLQKPREKGGLGLPNFQHYYWAANLRALMYWQLDNPTDPNARYPSWLEIERGQPKDTSVKAILFSGPRKYGKFKDEHYIMTNCQKILLQVRKRYNLLNVSVHAPIWRNHDFAPSTHSNFKNWEQRGIKAIADLYEDNILLSFEQLQTKYGLPKTDFFRYLQVRNFVLSISSTNEGLIRENELHEILLKPPSSKGLTTTLTEYFSTNEDYCPNHIKEKWEKELNIKIPDNKWETALKNISQCSVNSRLQLIQYKIIHRLHYSKAKVHKFSPESSPLCSRCKTEESTTSHHFWTCTHLWEFWTSIFKWLSDVLGISIQPDPEAALFGTSVNMDKLCKSDRDVINYGLLIAKRCILQLWKSDDSPHLNMWLREFTGVLHVERLRHKISGKL